MTSVAIPEHREFDDLPVLADAPLVRKQRGSAEAFDECRNREGKNEHLVLAGNFGFDEVLCAVERELDRLLNERNGAIHVADPLAGVGIDPEAISQTQIAPLGFTAFKRTRRCSPWVVGVRARFLRPVARPPFSSSPIMAWR